MVLVYGKPKCGGCTATKKILDVNGIPYEYRDITVDHDAAVEVANLGYTSLPVVVAGEDHWSGYRPDRIKALAVI